MSKILEKSQGDHKDINENIKDEMKMSINKKCKEIIKVQ